MENELIDKKGVPHNTTRGIHCTKEVHDGIATPKNNYFEFFVMRIESGEEMVGRLDIHIEIYYSSF